MVVCIKVMLLLTWLHYVKSVQIQSYFWSIFSSIWTECKKKKKKKNGPEKTLHLDTFYTQCSSEYKAFAIRETLQIKLSHNEYKV